MRVFGDIFFCIFMYVCGALFLMLCVFVYFRLVYEDSTGLVEFCLEETVCSVNVMTMPLSVTAMAFVW